MGNLDLWEDFVADDLIQHVIMRLDKGSQAHKKNMWLNMALLSTLFSSFWGTRKLGGQLWPDSD